ncbi:DUF1697 domain-containing protein [Microvirga rosea]|uniref:DUF1697 domain-containing protein n=1 Tax=Microvirga rosea TaxID=2715425 RepID=UPI001D0B59A4|nr:DUF1697 domain-containing protein [Microvirga rosea]MCB8820066.1 DUF1697 domain-containing protein [Microvirga rosea]
MPAFVALLRAVNVGGTGKLPMSDLKTMCETAGFASVRTYIASGNVVFTSNQTEAQVRSILESALEAYGGKRIGVAVRTAAGMRAVLAGNPFPDAAPNRTVAIFLNDPPTSSAIEEMTGWNGEDARLGEREIYVHYGDGMAKSTLKIPAAREVTARNMSTIGELSELASALEP